MEKQNQKILRFLYVQNLAKNQIDAIIILKKFAFVAIFA